MKPNISKQEALHELWKRGNLSWMCHAVQKEMYELFYNSPKYSTMVWLLARQTGKSYLLGILALEQANRKPNSIIKMVTDTKRHIESIFEPIFNALLETCPEELKPKYYPSKNEYIFPNGSKIQLAGTDNKHYEKLRGQKADLILIDEAGFCNDLETVVKSVLFPTTTHTGGKIILASTPPESPDHEFIQFIEDAELKGKLTKKTINDNPLLTAERKTTIAEEMGGIGSDRFRREYLCEIVRDSKITVIPEFTPEIEKEIVKEWPDPPFYDCYESMDIGFNDLTVILFAYFDFRADKLVIQDEIVVNGLNLHLPVLVKQIEEKEYKLWKNPLTNEVKVPYKRVSDINYIVTNELRHHSGNRINFIAADKDDNGAALNQLRVMIGAKKIIIHPRCTTLIRHLRNVKWASSNNKKVFSRSPDDGHYDAVDALKYMVRHVLYGKNPYPAHYGMNTKDLYVHNPDKFYAGKDQMNIYRKIFNVKRTKYGT